MPGMPARSTIQCEVATNPDFSGQYRRARALAGDFFAARVVEIADATLAGKYESNAARVAISAYQWTAAKLNPAEYGEHQRVDVAVTVADNLGDAPAWMRARLAPEVIEGEAHEVHESASIEGATDTSPPKQAQELAE